MIAAGALNRRINLRNPVKGRSPTGAETTTWTVSNDIWASQESVSLREIERMAGMANSAEAKFVIRHRQGVTPETQIQCGDKLFGVTSVEEIGNREGLRVFVRAV